MSTAGYVSGLRNKAIMSAQWIMQCQHLYAFKKQPKIQAKKKNITEPMIKQHVCMQYSPSPIMQTRYLPHYASLWDNVTLYKHSSQLKENVIIQMILLSRSRKMRPMLKRERQRGSSEIKRLLPH